MPDQSPRRPFTIINLIRAAESARNLARNETRELRALSFADLLINEVERTHGARSARAIADILNLRQSPTA